MKIEKRFIDNKFKTERKNKEDKLRIEKKLKRNKVRIESKLKRDKVIRRESNLKENKLKIEQKLKANKKLSIKDLNKKALNNKNNNIHKKNFYLDIEMNDFEYKKAILLDNRTYREYYFSLITKKQLFLFTFVSKNDYNLIQLKICLLLSSFSLYFTINGFFYTDSTMNKIYEDGGGYDFIYQISQLLYSSLI